MLAPSLLGVRVPPLCSPLAPEFRANPCPEGSFAHSARCRPLFLKSAVIHRPRQRQSFPTTTAAAGAGDSGRHSQQPPPPRALPTPSAFSVAGDSIGAEYGEGFLQFRLSGEKTRLDVDSLNEQLRVHGANRHRHSMRPDEAFGLVFCWDDVIVDSRALQRQAWKSVAEEQGLPFPSIERPQMFDLLPERAALEFQWTTQIGRARELAWLVASKYIQLVKEVKKPLSGVKEWLELMSKTRVPCALVTNLDRTTTMALLESMGLRHSFSALVTADDDMETISQRFLSASIKLGRPPNQCVAFAAAPAAIAAAHNCTMKAVAVLGPCTAPQLRAADLTVGSLSDLSVINVRRLFADRGSEFMDLRKSRVGQGPPGRRLMNATMDEDP